MSVWDRAAQMTDATITAQDDQERERARQACEADLNDLVVHQRVKLRSLIIMNEKDDLLPRAARVA
jgi:hypothetical protein